METIIEKSANVISKKNNAKKSALSMIGFVLGASIITVAAIFVDDYTSSTYLSLTTIGAVTAVVGLIALIAGGRDLIYTPTGSRIESYSIFFKAEEMPKLIYAIENGNTSAIEKLSGDSNSGARLDAVISEDAKFAACQIFRYVPHNFEPATGVYTISEEHLPTFCTKVKEAGSK